MPAFDVVSVLAVSHSHDFVFRVGFSDGTASNIDLADAADSPSLAKLREIDPATVEVWGGGIRWPEGPDVCPEWLHALATKGSGAHSNGDGWAELRGKSAAVPEICRFFGIVIRMFFDDHAPPHFHAECAGESITLEIDGDGMNGRFPSNRLPLVFEWRDRHRDELMANWHRLRRGESPLPIQPLE